MCIYCGSTNHISTRCHNRLNDNGENQGQHLGTLGNADQVKFMQQQVNHHQTRFDECLNRQNSPSYNNYCKSPLGSIASQDLSATLMELANIQSRSLEMMAASQWSQQKAFQELTRASKDKSNDAMFDSIKIFDGRNRQAFEDWIDKVNEVCRVSDREFRTEVFKKSRGTVQWVVLSRNELTDNELRAKLRHCFSHAPTMNEAREELRSMRQLEHKSVSVYIYKWG